MESRLLKIIILLLAIALPVKADNLGYSGTHPLVFGIDQDYPPLEFLDGKSKPSGLDVEFTKRLMKRLDIPFTFSPNTWENIADDVLQGKVDLAMMVFSPYRKDITNYSRAVFRLYYQMIYRKSDAEKRDFGLRHVEGKQIAFMESRPVIDTLTKAGARIHVVDDLAEATQDLAKGKYDAVICFRYQALYLLERYQLYNLTTEDLTLAPREYCFVSHDKALISAINKELVKMDEEGIIEEVYGDVRSAFGEFVIPVWLWSVLGILLLATLLFIIGLQIKARRRLQAEMERARLNAEQAKRNEERAIKSEELKDIFLSNVSHALRTPLNPIIGFSDLMLTLPREELPDEERMNLLGIINSSGLQLLHLINELLTLGNIENNDKLFDRQVTDIDHEMDSYASEIRMQLPEGVTLYVEEPVGGIRAMADRRLMRRVTMQMLENAMSFTKEGKIVLSYYVKEGGLYVEVADTGSGLPEELKGNIFELLSDKNTYTQEKVPGLGLSICKAIIDRCGGKIGAKDNEREGHGSIVWYWVPTEILF